MSAIGLTWKRYWRGRHCYVKRNQNPPSQRYESLCGRFFRRHSGGQKTLRPPAVLRCGICDGAEMLGVGAEASLPESPGWKAGQ
jgi:hypothetical protein